MQGRSPEDQRALLDTRSVWYRGFLLWLCLPPLTLLFLERPVAVIVVYAVMSALFMPFLDGTLLYLNTGRRRVGDLRNGIPSLVALLLCLLLFGYLAFQQFAGLAIVVD